MLVLSTIISSALIEGYFAATFLNSDKKRPSLIFMMLALWTAVTCRFGGELSVFCSFFLESSMQKKKKEERLSKRESAKNGAERRKKKWGGKSF